MSIHRWRCADCITEEPDRIRGEPWGRPCEALVGTRSELRDRIPRTIHYCWLGGGPKPDLVQSCIASWAQQMPDYDFVCWDESRFDVSSVPFVRQACAARKWAFASDYIRLYALYHYGGIYLDTDVRLFKRLDTFLHHAAFSGVEFHPAIFRESARRGSNAGLGILPAVMGAETHHPWIKRVLDFYEGKEFVNEPRFFNKLIIGGIMADISAKEFGFEYLPLYQVLKDDVHLYPPDVFLSYPGEENMVRYSTHLLASSWREPYIPPFAVKVIKRALHRLGLRRPHNHAASNTKREA